MVSILGKHFTRELARLALILSITAGLARAQAGSDVESGTSFQGIVRYENDSPAQFVQVELWTDGERSWRTFAITDRAGKFHTGAPCMVIKYKIEIPGFRPISGQVDMSINPCRALEVMTLRALPGTTIPGNESHSKPLDARVAGIPPEASKEFDVGQSAVKNDNFADAIPHLQKAIALYPRYAEAYQLLGVAQLQTGQSQQAETSLVKALEIEDRMPQVQYLLGVVYAKTSRADLAEKPLNRFVDLDPQNPDAHFELARVCFALSKFSDAEMHARKAIELKESNTGVYAVLGYALLRQNKPKAGRQAFQQFLKLEPNSPMAPDLRAAIDLIDSRSKR